MDGWKKEAAGVSEKGGAESKRREDRGDRKHQRKRERKTEQEGDRGEFGGKKERAGSKRTAERGLGI